MRDKRILKGRLRGGYLSPCLPSYLNAFTFGRTDSFFFSFFALKCRLAGFQITIHRPIRANEKYLRGRFYKAVKNT